MARAGIGADDIRKTITQLEAERVEPTVTAIRERLGTGSYSTISQAVQAWRQERAANKRPAVPEAPEMVQALFRQVWTESFRAADAFADTERQAHAKELEGTSKRAGEMGSEITRLEAALTTVQGELERVREQGRKVVAELEAFRVEHGKVEAAAGVLKEELKDARAEVKRSQDDLRNWIERATRAETRLEEKKKS